MGGYGSGRIGYRQKAEDCRSLDVNRLYREGCLRPGAAGRWVWWRGNKEVGRIAYHAEEARFVLNYRYRHYGDDWEDITEPVRIERVRCNFGGERPYFACPGVVGGVRCGRRVAKLFAGGRYFLCRHCYDIAYASQSEEMADRMLRRANRLRVELGGEPGMAYFIAPKPKGMWQRTYDRKRREILDREEIANRVFLERFGRFLK